MNALHGLAQRLVGQADDLELGGLVRQVRLDLDALAEAQARQDAVAAQRLVLDLLLTR